ncbi:hypothetical protein XAC3810_310001 [Xanthomonas citri pv. citri]|uniref:Uncharacterized protein n=1 Tax=Xanthomonas citri pv. citri TaxID=611301 RepID=A0A0U5FC53_XANCI|nr:hypothetical protein XAC9322_320123 [Xanthomonas citri pv. citri]CEE26091.1 hypothetical protein XAC1083_310122 [Xanthomonas citri pv. citri]CEE34743.1 hypothetical protein XAC3810_310001 [Xanthomonas citri pv. citri]CEE37269.1 hypothetical protein XAC902_450001 [Xanthomonas citri pv. citri]CEE37424.1 hypothetical protein XAC2911_310001 [Xanthomonas citri pv. citri]
MGATLPRSHRTVKGQVHLIRRGRSACVARMELLQRRTQPRETRQRVLTRQTVYLQSSPKERRNSSKSGTHLRQTGGFFVPASCRYKPMRCLRREGG